MRSRATLLVVNANEHLAHILAPIQCKEGVGRALDAARPLLGRAHVAGAQPGGDRLVRLAPIRPAPGHEALDAHLLAQHGQKQRHGFDRSRRRLVIVADLTADGDCAEKYWWRAQE
jgi:hypothetical protein